MNLTKRWKCAGGGGGGGGGGGICVCGEGTPILIWHERNKLLQSVYVISNVIAWKYAQLLQGEENKTLVEWSGVKWNEAESQSGVK